MHSHIICLLYLFSQTVVVHSSSVLAWNILGNSDDDLLSAIKKPSVERPLLVFTLPKFDLGAFSKAADVYSPKSKGGQLADLKSWMLDSQGYDLFSMDSPLRTIKSTLEPSVSDSVMTFQPDKTSSLSFASLIYIPVLDFAALNSAVGKIKKKLGSKAYTAVLVSGTENSVKTRSKRDAGQAGQQLSQVGAAEKATWVADKGCLFYAKDVSVVVKTTDDKPKTIAMPAPSGHKCSNASATSSDGTCCLMPANIVGICLVLQFNLAKFGTWTLSNFTIVKLDITDPKISVTDKAAHSSTEIEAENGFSFSCQEPGLYRFMSDSTTVGVQFTNLRLQAYSVGTKVKFGDADDCVGFFSIGIWMGIFSGFVLMMVFIFGISMITNLKTMDKFDDPRQKPLQISVKGE